jgi:PAS domain S-box-containing protein
MSADIPDLDLKHLLDHALDAVWVIDQDSTITFVNPVAEALTGYPVAELLGKPLSMILPKEYAGAHAGYVTGYLRRGRKPKVLDKVREFNILTRSGDLVPIELKAFELRSTDGRRRFGAIMRDISERKVLEEEQHELLERLAQMALVDELTGLPNHRAFFDAMGRLTSAVRRYGEPASVAVMDIDHFKRINDTFGHAAGDEVLRTVARICTP